MSASYVKNFLKVAPVSGDNSVKTYEYWFDQNYDEHVSGIVGEGGIADVNKDNAITISDAVGIVNIIQINK